MANNYYSGQGSILVSERDTSGNPLGFLQVGNVPELEISIEVTKYEHKESESGNRAVDISLVQEKKGTFRMLVENLSLENLAMGFWGSVIDITGASVTDEAITAPTDLTLGMSNALANPNVTAATVVVTDSTGTTTYVEDTDYTVDYNYGSITVLSTGSITAGEALLVDYDYGSTRKAIAFTEASMERYVRFEGLNTLDGTKDVLINMYRVQLDPITGYQLINEEIGQIELTGSLLYDATQTGSSKFFEQIEIG